jgi:hypothetical protein
VLRLHFRRNIGIAPTTYRAAFQVLAARCALAILSACPIMRFDSRGMATESSSALE